MKNQKVNPKALRMVVLQDNPLHAYLGRKFLQTEPDLVKRFNSQIAACR